MGVLNVTPDSFSDGGNYTSIDAALRQVETMLADGADIIDVGGESTRPGAAEVGVQQELDRVLPVIDAVTARMDTIISVDTSKPEVMSAALAHGAGMINDVTGMQDAQSRAIVAEADVPVCVMHMQGQPRSMQANPVYEDVVAEVEQFLQQAASRCSEAGIRPENIIIDPGIGFGKTLTHNLQLLAGVNQIASHGFPVLIGVSRKSMIGHLLDRPVDQRLPASLGLAVQAVINGAAIIRVHDVRETCDAIRSVEAVLGHSQQ